jgi:hypothetical protein
MAIVASEGFTVYVSKCRESFGKPYEMKLTVEGTGSIEGTDKVVTLNPEIAYDGKMTLDALVSAVEAALAGKTVTLTAAVAAAKK